MKKLLIVLFLTLPLFLTAQVYLGKSYIQVKNTLVAINAPIEEVNYNGSRQIVANYLSKLNYMTMYGFADDVCISITIATSSDQTALKIQKYHNEYFTIVKPNSWLRIDEEQRKIRVDYSKEADKHFFVSQLD